MAEKSGAGKSSGKTAGGKAASGKSAGARATSGKTAKSASSGGGRKASAGTKRVDPRRAILDAALSLAAERGWRDLSLLEIAETSGQPMSTVYEVFPSKTAILGGFLRDIEAQALGDVTPDEFSPDESPRDRLFDLVMRGFDAMVDHKKAVGEIAYDVMRDPVAAAAVLPHVARSMARTLETAGISASGLRGALRVKGLMAICLASLRSFLRDDTADLAKTMATLDGYLRRVESLASAIESRGRRHRPQDEVPPDPEGV